MHLSDGSELSSSADYSHFPKTTRTPNKTQRGPRKRHIPQALKWQLWLTHAGENFKAKCATPWCRTVINVTNFQAGHRLAESKGGPTTLENLVPICALCNQSMGTEHFDVWAGRGHAIKNCWSSLCALFSRRHQPQRPQKRQPSNVCDTQADTYHPPLQPPAGPRQLPQQIVLSNML
jgi:hypothetical protein